MNLKQLFKRSWWVFIFLGVSSILYFRAIHEKTEVYRELQNRLANLEKEKAIALEEQADLKLQIESQEDPAWIEMVLIRELGMVPDDRKKVYFKKTE